VFPFHTHGRTRLAAVAAAFVALLAAAFGCGASASRSAGTTPTSPHGSWWRPGSQRIAWQWELAHPLQLGNTIDMGLETRTSSGAPAGDPTVYDIDGFDTPASTVAALHRRGAHVICYIEIGAAEDYRPDYGRFPRSSLGKPVEGYPDERYLDIRDERVAALIKARISMCHQKGFDAVEPDIDDSYSDPTGFPLTEADNIAHDRALAGYAHSLGMAWGQKNGDADAEFSAELQPTADFLLDEQCFEYGTCDVVAPPYSLAGKPVFEAEYNLPVADFCAQANSRNFNSVRYDVQLDGSRQPCR
jgi:hypothetical protein